MLKPGEIEGASLGIERAFSEMEIRIMDDIVRRVRINGEITRSADWQIHRLHELGVSDEFVKRYIQDCLKYSEREMNELYYDVLRKGYYRDGAIYRGAGEDMIPFEENDDLQRLISAVSLQTEGELKNITQSLGFAVRERGRLRFLPIADYYQRTLDGAMLDISSGAFDYNTVLRRVTKELTNSGLRTVDYASGRSIRVESAARMCVMTGFAQLTAKVNEQNAEALDTEYFEVTWHGGARPEHQVWQGKVYTKDQLGAVCGLGAADGLCGCNCYHDYYPFIPGVSERTYTDEELDRMNREENTPKEYHGKEYTAYEATQRQRALERSMRAQRQEIHLLKTGGADEQEVMLARGKYRALSSEYTHFSKAMNIPQQRERVTVDGLGNVGAGKYTESKEPTKIPSLGSKITDKVTPEERRELLTRRYTEVQDEYFKGSTPGKGNFTYDKGCTGDLYKDELAFAHWLYDTLGGDIRVREERHDYEGQKNPDYEWNGKLWDLKTISTEKAANDAIKRGQKQIKSNPGGIILNLAETKYSEVELIKVINNRMKWYKDNAADIMVVSKGKIVTILRYKK